MECPAFRTPRTCFQGDSHREPLSEEVLKTYVDGQRDTDVRVGRGRGHLRPLDAQIGWRSGRCSSRTPLFEC